MPCRRPAAHAPAALLLATLCVIAGCSSRQAPRSVLAETCAPIGAQPSQWRIVSPANGPLRVAVMQRGISLVASSGATRARSPIDRFGVATLIIDAKANEPVAVTVRTRDSPDIVGEMCISADLLPEADERRMRAERALAEAGKATQAEDWRRAFDLYDAAASEFGGVDDVRVAQAHHAMSWIDYWNLRDDEGSYILAGWARADFGPGTDPGLLSSLFALQAYTLLEDQRFQPDERRQRVLDLLQHAEQLARRSKYGNREVPRFDILRGFVNARAGDTAAASTFYARAAEACSELHDWECAARARQNIAVVAEDARDYPAVLQEYQRALSTLPEDLDPTLTADIWGNYGRVQSMAGLFRQAELSHRKSMRLHANLADCDGTRMALARLGTLLVQVGNVGEGRIYLSRATSPKCATLIADARSESAADEMAPAAATGARKQPVCVDLPTASALSAPGRLAVFNALLGLNEVARLEKDEAQSARCLAGARDYAGTARTKLRLANAEGARLIESRDATQAGAAFERGLAVADGAKLAPTHENRSLAYLGLARASLVAGKPAQSRDFAERALTLSAQRGDLRQVADALQLIARGYRAESSPEKAASLLNVAADLIEQVPIDELDAEQRATWLATTHAVFAELTTLLAKDAGNDEARIWQAFAASERGRARSLRYAVSQATDTRATSTSEPASARYRELMKQITELAREAQNSPEAGPIPIERLSALIAQHAPAPDTMLSTLQRRLGALDATIVEYAAGDDDMLAFVITAEHIRVVPLVRRADVAAAATSLYELVRNPEAAASDVRAGAERLAKLALWPLADAIAGRRVIFVPDDALHTVPFAVLPWSAGKDSPLLIERMELSVMPSTLFVTRDGPHQASPRAAPRLELFGDPVFHRADWQRACSRSASTAVAADRERSMNGPASSLPRLPGSRDEVAGIAELARQSSPQGEVRLHLGCDATPEALREAAASGPALLHIATHGYVDAVRPRLSALVLTPDAATNGSGTFGLLDILRMKVDSRLVVLSACDTSRGRLLPGEGVLGPAQAFLQAGAASVVASYWRISDTATAQFMRTFYRHLLLEHLSASAALRKAQLEYASQGGPHDWAAFTLFGWPDTRL